MAEKQLTTIEQLRALAERGKQDTLIRINELLDSMIPLLESAQHTGITVTLPTVPCHCSQPRGLLSIKRLY